jgi:predicted dehydrogenase
VRIGAGRFGMTLHREKESTSFDPYVGPPGAPPGYAMMLRAILGSLPHGRSDVPEEETLEILRIIEAANESRKTGTTVSV